MPTTASQALKDRILRHELYLKQLANGTSRKVGSLLKKAEGDLVKQIEKRMAWIAERGYNASDFTLQRLESNLSEVRAVLRSAYSEVQTTVRGDLKSLAKYEGGWAQEQLQAQGQRVGVSLGTGLAEASLLSAIVTKQPFMGGLLKDWTARLAGNSYHRVRGAVRQGMLQGESVDKIVRRIVGTRAKGFRDAILQMDRNEVRSVVRTAVSSVANSAREATWQANSDVVKAIQWVSTLDDRTTPQCQIRDGKLYDLDYEPIDHSIPWGDGPGALHWNCRSTSAPVLASWEELGIEANELTGEQRATMDGSVPAETDFGGWLEHLRENGEPGDLQTITNILGARRAAAFIAGDIKLGDLFTDDGRFLTLDQLRLAERPAAVARAAQTARAAQLQRAALAARTAEATRHAAEVAAQARALQAAAQATADAAARAAQALANAATMTEAKAAQLVAKAEGAMAAAQAAELQLQRDIKRRTFNSSDELANAITAKNQGGQGKHYLVLDKDRTGRMEMLDTKVWNSVLGVEPDNDFFDAMFSDMRFNGAVSTRAGKVTLSGKLSRAGNEIGNTVRSFHPRGIVHHDYMRITQAARDAGLGKEILRDQFALYQKLGMKRVELTAGLDVGGYAWARFGFTPTKASWFELRRDLERKFDMMIQRGDVKLSMEEIDGVGQLFSSDDPRTLWEIADLNIVAKSGERLGKELLLGETWDGFIEFSDATAMGRFTSYVNRKKG